MKIIYANIVWFTAIIIGLVGAAFSRRIRPIWESMDDVRANYDVLYGILGILLIICIVGLILKKHWGYFAATYANAIFTILPIAIFFTSLVLLIMDLTFMEILCINLSNISVGIGSLVFWVLLVKLNIKNRYVQKSI